MLRAPDKPHHKHPHVYPIVSFDLCVRSSVENRATVVKVLPSRDLAEQEAERLEILKTGKECVYAVQVTRFIGTLRIAES
jgi:hypothetical protein